MQPPHCDHFWLLLLAVTLSRSLHVYIRHLDALHRTLRVAAAGSWSGDLSTSDEIK